MLDKTNVIKVVNEVEIHKLTKEALKGDIESLRIVLNLLTSLSIPSFKVIAYLIVYQTIMNLDPELANECQKCGGICCKIGQEIPLYTFDLEDLKNIIQLDINNVIKCSNNQCVLPRPCAFQDVWKCKIHQFKPYACLSYPFASEDVQYPVIVKALRVPPEPVIPEFCIAAKKIWDKINVKIKKFSKVYGRLPNPLELLYFYLKSD